MSGKALDRLIRGARRFRTEVYPPLADEYRHAAAVPQRPHSLVVACADSRVAIESIVGWHPGEVFLTRNIGSIVPTYVDRTGAVAAVVEYAVDALGVEHIAVCGHSDCGAMKALLHPEALEQLPAVKGWLAHARGSLPRARANCSATDKDLLPCLTEQNVLLQLEQLKTHPSVAAAMDRGSLSLSGWVYDIATGAVRICRDGETSFQVVD